MYLHSLNFCVDFHEYIFLMVCVMSLGRFVFAEAGCNWCLCDVNILALSNKEHANAI